MKGDLFKGIVQWNQISRDDKTKKLKELKTPIFFYDASSMTAIYSASTKLARQYLPDQRMHPLEITPGRCCVAVSAIEFHDTDLGPYNELIISYMISFNKKPLPVLSLMRQTGKRRFDMHIRYMPVTEESMRKGGIDMAGFPMMLANIDFTRDESVNRCAVSAKRKQILSLEGPVIPVKPGKSCIYLAYTVYNGTTVMCNHTFLYHEYGETRKTNGVNLTLNGDHPICNELKSIDLREKPISYHYVPSNESILFGPRNLMEC